MEQHVVLRTPQQARAEELICASSGQEIPEDDYLERLRAKGVTLNPKLFISKFKLKNGLPYTGMAVKQQVKAGQILIRVPEEMILSSAKAFEQPELIDIFRNDSFFHYDDFFDQDRIIITYSMFLLHRKEENNLWYQMIKHFPQQCDIACFWTEEELDQFKDPSIKSAAQIDLQIFEKEWADFEETQKKYSILQNSQFNKKNYKIIFIAVANRGFGSKVKYNSLVPMAEKFNHHCSRVFYTFQKYKNDKFVDEGVQTKSDISSLGSCESETYVEQGQFDYDDIQLNQFALEGEEDQDVSEKQKIMVLQENERLTKMIDEEINWEDFSVLFVGHFIMKIKVITHEFSCGRKPFERALAQFDLIERTLSSFRSKAVQYYQQINKKPYMAKKVKKYDANEPKISKDYESLIMKTSRDDKVPPNNQIYFNYGQYSNRSLLLHYGFAIEGNKYEHAWLSFNITQCVGDFPDVLDKVVARKISLFRKFKVYSHRLCMDMVIFFRLNNWTFWGEKAVEEIFSVINYDKQIAILEQIANILNSNIEAYDEQYDLTDTSLNYHQYFTAVYHLQKLHILQRQAKMISILIDVLTKLEKGTKVEEATIGLTKAEKVILKPYLETILQ